MRALIIANGTLPDALYLRSLAEDASLVICADGGANHCVAMDIMPDIILGDFDSITARTKTFFGAVPQIKIDDAESTDLEKAIRYCISQSIKFADIVGAIGTRIDHSTGSLGCFKKYGSKIDLRIMDQEGELTLLKGETVLDFRKGEKLSLIPLDRCSGVSTVNLKYPLKDEVLELGVREGISNEAASEKVTVRVSAGTLLLYRFRANQSTA